MSIEKINEDFDQIAKDFNEGNPLAKKVMEFGQMYNRCKEPGAEMFLEEAYKEWKQSKNV